MVGLILWNGTAICEMFKTSWQMGKTPYERRFGELCKGPVIPFGAMVEYHPCSAKDLSRLHRFGKKVLPGILLGYALYAGGIWKGDILVADIEEVEKMDTSEIHARRLQAKEVSIPQKGDEFIFPVPDGTAQFVKERPRIPRTLQGGNNL